MKFLVVFCLLAFAAAEEDKTQEKKTQPADTTQNTSSSLTQPSLLNSQVFPTSFSNVFGTNDPVSPLSYTGFNGNVSPVQTINPDFFTVPTATAIPAFPVTRTVLPGTSPVVNGIQSGFPATGNVFPAIAAVPASVNGITNQFPVGTGILSAVPTGTLDANTAAANGVISPLPNAAYRFLTPDALPGIPTQGLQPAQQIGLAAIPAFTSGILPSLSNGILQNQNIPAGIQQVLKNPTNNPSGISNVPGLTTGNISSGQLTNFFRHA